ncbi:MAG: hypothetical protein H0V66_06310, partial [Bdellovibrionales bacterium]|nr:hypothetical protein [Bdellovibrionales bacterium]
MLFGIPFNDDPIIETSPSTPKKLEEVYCLEKKGSSTPTSNKIVFTENFKCDFGRSPQFFYEAWKGKYTKEQLTAVSFSDTDPQPQVKEILFYKTGTALYILKQKPSYKNCEQFQEGQRLFMKCPNDVKIDVTNEIAQIMWAPDFNSKVINAVYSNGEKSSTNNDQVVEDNKVEVVSSVVEEKKVEVVTPPVIEEKKVEVNTPPVIEVKKDVVIIPKEEIKKDVVVPPVVIPDAIPKVDVKDDLSCKEDLKKEIAALLALDSKNIIGLQYELTVLKVAAAAYGYQTTTVEGLIKKQSKQIAALDNGIIEKMNTMYKTHGLPEDAAAISNHLKEKSSKANYYAKDKRFFNQDSSAFLLAFQNLNPNANIKDSDVSVLWFMDKVSEKSKGVSGQYSSAHNRTNLSTRVAQYTGAINPKKAISKADLEEMIKGQKSKIDKEFLDLIQAFKTSNPECYAKLFGEGDGDQECNLN